MNSRTNTLTWCVAYYVVVGVFGTCDPFIVALDSSAILLSQIAFALPASYWLINDVKIRGNYLPHVIQPAIVNFWFFVVPVYVIWTRRWWGLLYITLHFAATYSVTMVGYYIAAYILWPIVFPVADG